MTDEISSLYLF